MSAVTAAHTDTLSFQYTRVVGGRGRGIRSARGGPGGVAAVMADACQLDAL